MKTSMKLLSAFLLITAGATAWCEDAEDMQRLGELIIKYEHEAALSKDAVLIWHQAALLDELTVRSRATIRSRAIFEISKYSDERSLPVLDKLGKDLGTSSDVRPLDGPRYPQFAMDVATEIRARLDFKKLIANTPIQLRQQKANDLYSKNENPTSDIAFYYLLELPASDQLIDIWLTRPENQVVRRRLLDLQGPEYECLYRKIDKTDDAHVIEVLSEVFKKKKDPQSIPVLWKVLSAKPTKPKNNSTVWQVVVALALASFGDGILEQVADRWGRTKDCRMQEMYAIICKEVGTEKARSLTKKWLQNTRKRLGKVGENGTAIPEEEQNLLFRLELYAGEMQPIKKEER